VAEKQVERKITGMSAEDLPTITLGIPTYNRAWVLPRFLEAVEKCDYPKQKIRIVFVDNFSEDDTPKILKEFKERLRDEYESIVLISEKSNIPEARNICVKESVGEHLLFLDSDVISPPNTIRQMLEVFSTNPRIGIVGFPYHCEPMTIGEKMYFSKQPRGPHVAMVIGMGCTMIKRDIFKQIGVFDSQYLADEDADLTVRATQAGYVAMLDPTIQPLHLTKERLHGTVQEIFGGIRYSFGGLAKYHFKILIRYRPRWMINKIVFYLTMAISTPIAVVGIIFQQALLTLPFIACAGVALFYHFPKASGRWRIINSILYPLLGMSFALGILNQTLRYVFVKRAASNKR